MRAAPGTAPGTAWQGIAWGAVALLIWGGWFGVTRAGVRGTLGVMDVAVLRVGIGGLVLLPALLGSARGIPASAWRQAVVLAVCWGAPFLLLLGRGIQLTSAAHAAGLTPSTMPVFAGLLAWGFRGDRPPARRLAGFGVIVVSAVVLTLSAGEDSLWGDVLLLAASLLWAVYTLRVARTGLRPVEASALVCLYSIAVLLPVYLLSGVSRLSSAPAGELLVQALYQGVLAGALATVAFTRAVAVLGPASAATITSLVPLVAMLLAIPIVGEWPNLLELSAGAAVAGGVVLAASGRRVAPAN